MNTLAKEKRKEILGEDNYWKIFILIYLKYSILKLRKIINFSK